MEDIIGKKFNALTVIAHVPRYQKREKSTGKFQWVGGWECLCDCGNKITVLKIRLTSQKTKSCGCLSKNKTPDLLGKTFGRLTVLEKVSKEEGLFWKCVCTCGETRYLRAYKLTSGASVSCGCSKREYKPSEKRKENQKKAFLLQREKTFERILDFIKDKGLVLDTKKEHFVTLSNPHRDHINFRCVAKNHSFSIAWFNLKYVDYCRQCFQWKSHPEQEMRDFIIGLVGSDKVKPNVKNLVAGVNEIDIYLPDHKLAIEHNGLYWHSLGDQKRHRVKRELLEKSGITCIQINGDEWAYKRPIVESMLKSRLGISEKPIYARELEVFFPSPSEANSFVEENHLMGPFKAARALGLKTKEGELVCLLSYRKSGEEIEIARMCSKLGYHIAGGVSKLIANIPLEGAKRIVSYVDLRYATGHSLIRLGFKLSSISLGWKWTDGKHTYNRLACRANMDDRKLTEKEQAEEFKWTRIYDAGQALFVKDLF